MGHFRHFLKEEETKKHPRMYIGRHGRTTLDDLGVSDGANLDFPLSDEGCMGLIKPINHLRDEDIKKIYAPDLRRTKETARIIRSGIFSKPPVHVSDVAHTWDLGTVAGQKKKVTRPMVQMFMDSPNMVPPKGESYNQFKARYCPWLADRQQEAIDDGPILLILSGSNIRELSQQLTGDKSTLDLDEGGLIRLCYKDGKWCPEILSGAKDKNDENLS